ncbi:hypothetical protein KRX52_14510 [Pseudomonas sp. MAP12]|uniref:Uncharacterized protein n=1 Tax=Geopseudomonas aromaticivorans TaxID=2849492 RepID=A0ABS6MYX5_9GAMM|nr:hypothetical protein [Pseudomonas aromaticivorans]MBV2133990.1 hypothetical protein [Pseudomonas aromaticivorans]
MDQWINGSMDQWINGSMDQWINGSMDQWINGSMACVLWLNGMRWDEGLASAVGDWRKV